MAQVIAVHSFRGGTGKSNIVANSAAILASQGMRVGVVDTDIQSPGIHILFGIKGIDVQSSLNDYLWGNCAIKDAALDVTQGIGDVSGKVFLIPSSVNPGAIARVLREAYDDERLREGLQRFISDLELDVLMIDTHPGLNEETLLSIAICNAIGIVMRPDEQDYEGTGVTVQVARRLRVPNMLMVVNKVPGSLSLDQVKREVEQAYHCKVAGVLPHSDELMTLASRGLFAIRYPNHPISLTFREIATELMKTE